MKSGTVHALGYESRLVTNPASFLPLLGALQFLVFLFLDTFPWIRLTEFFQESFLVSFGLMLVSIVTMWLLPRSPTGSYDVSYVDNRDSGGNLIVSYVDSKGRKRTDLLIDRVRAYPKRPLTRKAKGGPWELRISQTVSSMAIGFKHPRICLALGFYSVEEMVRAYEQLR